MFGGSEVWGFRGEFAGLGLGFGEFGGLGVWGFGGLGVWGFGGLGVRASEVLEFGGLRPSVETESEHRLDL